MEVFPVHQYNKIKNVAKRTRLREKIKNVRFPNYYFKNLQWVPVLSTEKTLSEVIEILRLRGYTEDFNLLEENISYKIGGEKVNLSDIVIDKIYRFTGLNDLED